MKKNYIGDMIPNSDHPQMLPNFCCVFDSNVHQSLRGRRRQSGSAYFLESSNVVIVNLGGKSSRLMTIQLYNGTGNQGSPVT